jgi:hypothetical protein
MEKCRKCVVMLIVLAVSVPAFGAIKARNDFNASVGPWTTFDSGTDYLWSITGGETISHAPGGSETFPAGNPVFGGAMDISPSAAIFHWDSRANVADRLFGTTQERTFEMWFAPRQFDLGAPGNGTFGGTLLVLDGNGMFGNGNLFFFDNGVAPGQQLFFQSSVTGTVESGARTWNANEWHHVAISWNATNIMVGLDGIVLSNTAHGGLGAWSWADDQGGFLGGLPPNTASNGFDGWFDDVTISDTGKYVDPNNLNATTYPVPTEPIGFVPPLPPGEANVTASNNYDDDDDEGDFNFSFTEDPDFGVFVYSGLDPNGGNTPFITTTGLKEDCGGALDPSKVVQSAAALGPQLISTTFSGVAGTIEMWVSPNWNGTSAGGQGVGGSSAAQDLLLFTDGGGNGHFRPGLQLFIFNNNSPNDGGQLFAWWEDGLQVGNDRDMNSGVGTTASWTAGSWHHIAFCWDPNELGLYLDGEVVEEVPRANPATDPFSNGVQLYGFDKAGTVIDAWDGKIDDLTISDGRRYFGPYQLPDSLCAGDTCADVWAAGNGLLADFDQNCDVELLDLIQLINDWLRCNDPSSGGCEQTW